MSRAFRPIFAPLRALLRGAAVVAFAALFPLTASCASDGGGGEGGSGGPVAYAAPGTIIYDSSTPPLPLVEILQVDTSALQTEGKVKYVISNVSGLDLEDLISSVTFHFPPGKQMDEIQMTEEKETTSERPLTLYKNDHAKAMEAVCPDFTGDTRVGKARGTTLTIQNEPPVPVLPRTSTMPGTLLYNSRLECVAISTPEELEAAKPAVWVEFENTDPQKRKAADLEVQVVFPYGGGRTPWKPLATMAPGARARVDLDVKGVNLGDGQLLVKVRPQAL